MAVPALGLAALLAWLWPMNMGDPRRFAAVEAGRIYRSGRPLPAELSRLTSALRLRSVVSLLNPEAPESQTERAAAEALGLRWINIPLPGDGESTPADRERILDAIRSPENQPLLVHCAAGATRTGLAVGLFRLHEGWSAERILDEARKFGFEDQPHHQSVREALSGGPKE